MHRAAWQSEADNDNRVRRARLCTSDAERWALLLELWDDLQSPWDARSEDLMRALTEGPQRQD